MAIKNFLAATQTAKRAPHYVLLVGDASYDPRNFLDLASNPDLVPTKLINTQLDRPPAIDGSRTSTTTFSRKWRSGDCRWKTQPS